MESVVGENNRYASYADVAIIDSSYLRKVTTLFSFSTSRGRRSKEFSRVYGEKIFFGGSREKLIIALFKTRFRRDEEKNRKTKKPDGKCQTRLGARKSARFIYARRENTPDVGDNTPKMSSAEAATYSYLTDSFSRESERDISLRRALFPRARVRAPRVCLLHARTRDYARIHARDLSRPGNFARAFALALIAPRRKELNDKFDPRRALTRIYPKR